MQSVKYAPGFKPRHPIATDLAILTLKEGFMLNNCYVRPVKLPRSTMDTKIGRWTPPYDLKGIFISLDCNCI